jgi:hypothetical protein
MVIFFLEKLIFNHWIYFWITIITLGFINHSDGLPRTTRVGELL